MKLPSWLSFNTGTSGSFRRNTLIMSSGAFINVLFSLILYPIVTRIYSKEDFGDYGLIISVVSILSLAGTALYPTGIVIPKFRASFYALVKLCFTLTFVTLVVTILWILFFQKSFLYIFKLHGVRDYLYLIPIGVVAFSLKTIFININVRRKLFKYNAISNVAGSFSMKSLNVGYALLISASSFGLLITHFVSVAIQILTLGIGKIKRDIIFSMSSSFDAMRQVAIKYKKYPLHLLPGNLINKYTSDLPIYLLTAYFNSSIVGAFVLANSIMLIPLNVIGNSMSSVFLQKSNELYIKNPRELSKFTSNLNRKMVALGVVVFGFLFGFGDIAFCLVFGKKWLLAGQIAIVLSICFVMKLIAGPLAVIFKSVGKEQYSLYASVVLGVLRTAGLYAGLYYNNFMKAVWFFTIGNAIGYLFTLMLVYRSTNLPTLKLVSEILLILLAGFALFYLLRMGLERLFDLSFLYSD